MADKLIIVLANSEPTDGKAFVSPLFQATVAAAMEYEVEVIFSGRAAEMTAKVLAQRTIVDQSSSRTVHDCIKEAHQAGVRFKACATGLTLGDDTVVPEIEEMVGTAYIISEAMDDDTVVFTY